MEHLTLKNVPLLPSNHSITLLGSWAGGAKLRVWTCPLSRLWPTYGCERGEQVDRRGPGLLLAPLGLSAAASRNMEEGQGEEGRGWVVWGGLRVFWTCWSWLWPEAQLHGDRKPQGLTPVEVSPRMQSWEGRVPQLQTMASLPQISALEPKSKVLEGPSKILRIEPHRTPLLAGACFMLLTITHYCCSNTSFPFKGIVEAP